MTPRPRAGGDGRPYWPVPVAIEADPGGRPRLVERVAVEAIREEWLVEDRWWTPRPLRRRYFEVVLGDGRCTVVFCELAATSDGDGHWFEQRA